MYQKWYIQGIKKPRTGVAAMLDPIVESIEYRLLVFDFFPYGIWNVAHGRVRAAARTQHTGVPMPEMRSVPVHRRIGFLNDLFYGRSHIAGPGESSIALLLDEKPAVVPVGSRRERSGGTRRFLRAPMAMNSSERRRRLRWQAVFGCQIIWIDRLDEPAHGAVRGSISPDG